MSPVASGARVVASYSCLAPASQPASVVRSFVCLFVRPFVSSFIQSTGAFLERSSKSSGLKRTTTDDRRPELTARRIRLDHRITSQPFPSLWAWVLLRIESLPARSPEKRKRTLLIVTTEIIVRDRRDRNLFVKAGTHISRQVRIVHTCVSFGKPKIPIIKSVCVRALGVVWVWVWVSERIRARCELRSARCRTWWLRGK